jgi:diguanylate cyclase (GGDEF)-like protein/PAS domain S-box-containing protein
MPRDRASDDDTPHQPGLGAALPERAELERFRLLADSVPALIAYYERTQFTCLYANRAYASTFGLTPQQAVGRTYAEIVGAEAGRMIADQVQVLLAERRTVSYERTLTDADGKRRAVEVSLVPHALDGGDVVGAFVLISDVTHHHELETALRESEERMAKFMHAGVEGILFHRDGVVTDVNAPIEALLGMPAAQIIGRQVIDFVAPASRARSLGVMAHNEELTFQLDILNASGQAIPVEVITRNMMRGDELRRLVVVRDIRDRLAAQARIHHLAHHDTLTGLPNRMAFMQRLEQALSERQSAGGAMALMFVDLDHFKRVNDSLGHLAGDELLRTVSNRLVDALRGSDVVGRFGGDEFMVLLSDVADRRDAEGVARKLLQVVQAPVKLQEQVVSVSPSIGIAFFPRDGAAPEDLVKHADTAMYVAKSEGRAGYRFFEPAMASRAYAAIVLEAELAQALQAPQFELLLVPRVRLADSSRAGAQALIRWRHPQRGLLGPDAFASVAAERRLLPAIVAWALQEAQRLFAGWHAAGLSVPSLSLDLASLPLGLPEVAAIARRALAVTPGGSAGGAQGLALQLSESMLGQSAQETRRLLGQLEEMGLPVDVAEFALGPPAIIHLRTRPVRSLGLARGFIGQLPQDDTAASIARALIAMARGLGLTVTAEGVETAAQLAWLAHEGCAMAQGPLVAPTMTAPEFEAWWRTPRSGGSAAANRTAT